MAYFPLFVDLENKNILIVGGGKVAYRKVIKLLPFEAKITIVSPEICLELQTLLENNKNLVYKKKDVDVDDIKGAFVVILATNNSSVNNWISEVCRKNNILINSVDDMENCSFIFPALIKKGAFVAGISTSGKTPDGAAFLRDLVEQALPEKVDEIIENLGNLRRDLKLIVPEQKFRAEIMHSLLGYYSNNNFELSYEDLQKELKNLVNNISVKI